MAEATFDMLRSLSSASLARAAATAGRRRILTDTRRKLISFETIRFNLGEAEMLLNDYFGKLANTVIIAKLKM